MRDVAPLDTLERRSDGNASPRTVPEILTGARALLQQNGLHKGSMYPASRTRDVDGTGRVRYEPGMPLCLLAACRVADTGSPWTGDAEEAIAALHATLRHRTGRPLGVGSWQDSSGPAR